MTERRRRLSPPQAPQVVSGAVVPGAVVRGAVLDGAVVPRALLPLLMLVLLLCAALSVGASPAAAQQVSTPLAATPVRGQASPGGLGPVVVVGAPGLGWDDLDAATTPALAALAQQGAIGALSVRSAGSRTCPGDGWVMLGTGNRARLEPSRSVPCPAVLPGVEVLPEVRADNATLRFDSEITALTRVVSEAGGCVAALGGNGAELATGVPARPLSALDDATAECDVVVVDAGAVHHDERLQEDLQRVDAVVARVLESVSATGAGPGGPSIRPTVLVAGLSDTSVAGETGAPDQHLHVAVAAGPDFSGGGLVSASTRRAPYVQVVDIAPTVLAVLGLEQPPAMTGQPWRQVDERLSRAELVDLDVLAGQMRLYTPRFFLLLVVAQLVLYGGALLVLRHLSQGDPARDVVRRVASRTALVFAAAPVSTYLANLLPWWRADPVLPALLGAIALFDLLIVLVALLGPWRRTLLGPVGAVCAVTALVLAADLVSGARLQMSSLAGYSPLVAGRFAGVGNVAFAVFAAAAILATACALHGRSRRTVLLGCTAAGLAAVAVDGNPAWGSDFGGVLALIPGFAVLAMLAAGIRVSVWRLALVGLAAVGSVTAFALVDHARPPQERSHLGRFVEQVVQGDAATVIQRKAEANLGLLTHSVLTLLVPLLVLFVAQVVLRPRGPVAEAFRQAPVWRAGLIAVLVMSLIGFAVNDSGVAVPALAMTIAVPAAIAVAVRATAFAPHR